MNNIQNQSLEEYLSTQQISVELLLSILLKLIKEVTFFIDKNVSVPPILIENVLIDKNGMNIFINKTYLKNQNQRNYMLELGNVLEIGINKLSKQYQFKTLHMIVFKLKSNFGIEKYNDLSELRADLEKCLKIYQSEKKIPLFFLENNKPKALDNVLYGRKDEHYLINNMVDTFTKKSKFCLIIKGEEGIGKTQLVDQYFKPIFITKGIVLSCKGDQNRDHPYNGFKQICKEMLHTLKLHSSGDELIQKIKADIGNSAQVLIDILPEAAQIFKIKKITQNHSQNETEQQLYFLVETMFRIITKMMPLAFFYDDFQWISNADRRILLRLASNKNIPFFLVISTRSNSENNNEISAFINTDLRRYVDNFASLSLRPLLLSEISELIKDYTDFQNINADKMAAIILKKTKGIPFFIKQIFHKVNNNYIQINNTIFEETEKIKPFHEVIENISNNIDALSKKSQETLIIAALLGNQFSTKDISFITGEENINIHLSLWPAFNCNLIYGSEQSSYFKFTHDKIQSAVLVKLSQEQKYQYHFRIASILYKHFRTSPESISLDITDLAYHFNQSKVCNNLLNYQINIDAGNYTFKTAAYDSAIVFYEKAQLTSENAIKKDNLSILSKLAMCYWFTNQQEKANSLFKCVFENTKEKIHKSFVLDQKSQLFSFSSMYKESINEGILAAQLINKKIPQDPSTLRLIIKLVIIMLKTSLHNQKNIPKKNKFTQEQISLYNRILANLAISGFFYNHKLMMYALLDLMNIELKYGHSIFSPFAFVGYATALNFVGLRKQAYSYGLKGINLCDQHINDTYNIRAKHIFNDLICHWFENIEIVINNEKKLFMAGLGNGDRLFSSFMALDVIHFSFLFSTKPLHGLLDKIDFYRLQNQLSPREDIQMKIYKKHIENLTQKLTADKDEIDETACQFFDIELRLYRMLIFIIFNKIDLARSEANNINKHVSIFNGCVNEAEFLFYKALLIGEESGPFTIHNHIELNKIESKFKQWSNNNKGNFDARYLIVKSINHYNKKQKKIAHKTMLAAIKSGRKHLRIKEIAFAYEWLYQKSNKQNSMYLKYAISYYKKWGATAKVTQLKEQLVVRGNQHV